MKRRILFVCTGNVCRSPMAAALLAEGARQAGDAGQYEISSAGTWAMDGEPASSHARSVMHDRGLDLDRHRSQTVTDELVSKADLILVMTRNHRDSLCAEFPSARRKTHLLSELAGQQYDVGDPMGKSREDYEACAAELARLVREGYPQIGRWLAPEKSTEK